MTESTPVSAEGSTVPDDVTIEPATADDRLDVLRVLDASMLETDADTLTTRIAAGDVLVARFDRTGAVVGALVATRPAPNRLHVDAIAVRRQRRGRGIGSTLVASMVRYARGDPDVEHVTAAFDASLAEFYTGIGFTVGPTESTEPTEQAKPTEPTETPESTNYDRLLGRLRVSTSDDGER